MFHLLCLAILTFTSACVPVHAAKDSTITTKVFFDIEMDGKPAGKLETPLYNWYSITHIHVYL